MTDRASGRDLLRAPGCREGAAAPYGPLPPSPDLASFVASPIAFNDDVGNRIRPSVQSIATVAPDGAPLGSFTHDQIFALNELER